MIRSTNAGDTRPITERGAAWIGALLVGLGPVCLALYTPILPTVTDRFGVDPALGALTLTIYMGGFMSMQLICGPLSDQFGRLPVARVFALLFLAGSVGTLLAPDMGWFLAARLLQGIGAAAGVAIGRAIVLDLFEAERAVPVMNLLSLILAAAPAAAPFLGGIAAEHGGVVSVLSLMLALGLVQLVVLHAGIGETRQRSAAPIRLRRLITDYLAMLREPRFLWPTFAAGATMMAFQMLAVVLPFVLVAQMGLTEFQFGLVMLANALCYLLGNLAGRVLIRRISPLAPVKVGVPTLILAMVAAVSFYFWPEPAPWGAMIPGMISGFAGAMIFPTMVTFAILPFRHAPGAAAALNMFLQLAAAIAGATFVGFVPDPNLGLVFALSAPAALATLSFWRWRRIDRRGSRTAHPFER